MILLLLVFPTTLSARMDEWVRVAERDLAFARALASDHVKFGPEFREQVIAGRVWNCKPQPSKLAGLEETQVRHLNRYCEDYCLPWKVAWSRAVSPCDRRVLAPRWCLEGREQLAAEHFEFSPYFETLTAAILASTDPLMRYNVMAIISDRLDSNDLRDFPLNMTEPWVTVATSAYLERATPDDAIAIARLLSYTQFGPSPGLVNTIETFIRMSDTVTDSQRTAAKKVVSRLRGEIVEEEEVTTKPPAGALRSDSPQTKSPQIIASTPEKVNLLVQRIDRYYSLNREKRYDESYELLADDYREKRNGMDEWAEGCKIMDNTGRIIGWHVRRIQIAGPSAKVTMDLRISAKDGFFGWHEMSDQRTVYWTFENTNWFYTVESIHDWGDDRSVEVPVPTTP